jgi:hypothetical protein
VLDRRAPGPGPARSAGAGVDEDLPRLDRRAAGLAGGRAVVAEALVEAAMLVVGAESPPDRQGAGVGPVLEASGELAERLGGRRRGLVTDQFDQLFDFWLAARLVTTTARSLTPARPAWTPSQLRTRQPVASTATAPRLSPASSAT